jgi:hypothetical protein
MAARACPQPSASSANAEASARNFSSTGYGGQNRNTPERTTKVTIVWKEKHDRPQTVGRGEEVTVAPQPANDAGKKTIRTDLPRLKK